MLNSLKCRSRIVLPIVWMIILPMLVLTESRAQDSGRYRVMFYNVENLFDTFNDTLINDEEFLPESQKHWDDEKYYAKLNNIYRVIISCGEWDPPAVVGLCEVENRKVLEDLVRLTPLSRFDYRIVHFESSDERGIDVALLYRGSLFNPDTAYPIHVRMPGDPTWKTRDILYVKGDLPGKEIVHFFVNHWPSRYGGYEATRPKRNLAAIVLRTAVDSILQSDPGASVVAMGDFNDGPYDESMLDYLLANTDTTGVTGNELINLTGRFAGATANGTIKYRENWDVFDQMVVSANLLLADSPLFVSGGAAQIHQPDFLLVEDEAFLGVRPFRTFAGMKYLGGYSDHLPVYLDLRVRKVN